MHILFKVTGLGARQQQLQEAFAPSSFARVKAGVRAAARDLPAVCSDEASGARLISSREWSLQTLYDCVGRPAPAMQVMDLVRVLFEGLCTKAVWQAQKEAMKGLGSEQKFAKPPKVPAAAKKAADGKPQVAFGSGLQKEQRRVGEYLSAGELRLQDYALLQDVLLRARLPQGCGTAVQMDSIKRLFVAKRTPVATVLQLDGFCDGMMAMAELILGCLRAGDTEEMGAPSPALEAVPWGLEHKAGGISDLAFVLHRFAGRLIALTASDLA